MSKEKKKAKKQSRRETIQPPTPESLQMLGQLLQNAIRPQQERGILERTAELIYAHRLTRFVQGNDVNELRAEASFACDAAVIFNEEVNRRAAAPKVEQHSGLRVVSFRDFIDQLTMPRYCKEHGVYHGAGPKGEDLTPEQFEALKAEQAKQSGEAPKV